MLKRAKVPDLNFCGCSIYLETASNEITDADIQSHAGMFANITAESERERNKIKRYYGRRAREVLDVV